MKELLSTYAEKPNKVALEQQREKYVIEAMEKVWAKEDLDDLMFFKEKEVDDIIKELKKRQGINEDSSEKAKEQFETEFSPEIIKDILNDHREERASKYKRNANAA